LAVSFARRLRYALTATVVGALVLLAVAFSSLRVLVAYAPAFRGTVESVLGEVLDRPLTLGGLRAEWSGWHPRLILEQVRLQGEGAGRGQLVGELRVDIDLIGSLRTMQLKPAEIGVTGLTVTVQRDADGGWRVLKIGDLAFDRLDGEQDTPIPELPAQLHLSKGRLVLIDAVSQRTHQFSGLDLRLDSSRGRHALAGYVTLPEELGRNARFRIELSGLPGDGASPDGRLYLDVDSLNLDGVGKLLGPSSALPAMAGNVDAELWLDVERGKARALTGTFKSDRLRIKSGASSDWLSVAAQLSGRFRWQREADGWSLATDELSFVSDYRVWPRSNLEVRYRDVGLGQELELYLPYLRLDDVMPTLSALPMLPAELAARLGRARPRGELQGSRLSLRWSDQGVQRYALRTRFIGLALEPLGAVPGVRGLSGELRADQDGGGLKLDGSKGQIEFATLFREALPFRSLRAEAGWQRLADGWQVEASRVEVDADDGRLTAQARVFLDDSGSPFLDVRAHLENGNGASTSRYLPVTLMTPDLVQWLDSAIRGGRVPAADFVMYGRASDFPYGADTSGVFDVRADVVNARLDYFPGWPGLEALVGVLHFDRNSLDITAADGRVFGARVREARVWMDDLVEGDLQFEGRVRGSGADMLRFLRESPLGEPIRRELAMVSVSGTHDLSLRATVPLHGGMPKVNGTLSLRGGSLSIPRWGIGIDGLQGPVQFTERGVHSDGVRGSFRGHPVTIGAVTEGPAGNGRIRVSAPVHGTPQELLGVDALPGVSGSADWLVELLFPAFDAESAGNARLTLRASSDLAGLAVALPEPLHKPADQSKPLSVQLSFDRRGMSPIRLSYGAQLRGIVELDDSGQHLTRASLQLGGQPAELNEFLGLSITGRVERLDLDAWRRVDLGTRTASASDEAPTPTEAPPAAQVPELPLEWVDLEVGRLIAAGQHFRQTRLQARRDDAAWQVNLAGPELAGRVVLPDAAGAPLAINLDRLRLDLGEESPTATRATAPKVSPSIPPLQLSVGELYLGGQNLGRLEAAIAATAGGMLIDRAELKGPAMTASATGGWSTGADPQARLQLQVTSVNAGKALTALGYADAIRGGVADVKMDLTWPGGPADFDLGRVSGTLNMDIANGQVLSVEPGAGRLFGLLSIAALPRRLSLDFSDLFGEGFAFDRIEARLNLKDGDAFAREFYMQGPAARVELEGRIGLGKRDYDQVVTVMPHISSALPAVGAVAGGPVGAAALLVTQKLLEKQLDKLIKLRYRVKGSWDQPDIDPVDAEQTQAENAPS